MRKLIARLWSGVSVVVGVLGELPSVPALSYPRLALAQGIASEDPGAALLAGVVGVWKGLRARSGWAVVLGVIGILLNGRRLLRRDVINQTMSDAMREGLGPGWQRDLPPEVHRVFGQSHRGDMWGPLIHAPRLRVHETRDVLFAAPGGYPLRMDIYRPRDADGPHPAVIVVHGGVWLPGDKSAYAFGLHNRWLAAQGYVVFDVQYRLAGRWPVPLADVKCAIRWVKTNAVRYGVDPARVVILGRSVGAYLSLMAAYTANQADFPAACLENAEIDESVQAVVACYPPTDLRLWMAEQGSAIEQLLVGLNHDVPQIVEQITPIAHVRPGLPPTMIVHGQRDRTVPLAHAEMLANHLRAVGVTTVLLQVPWGRHGIDSCPVGLTAPMILYDVDRFLAWVFSRQG
jgi:acetyl esterase/lipase